MLVDSITLLEGSTFDNLTIISGTVFPVGSKGELFFRTDLNKLFVFSTTWDQIASGIGAGASEQVLKATFTGPISTQAGIIRYYPPSGMQITKVYASIGTPGANNTEIDIKLSGTTVFNAGRPIILAGQYLSPTKNIAASVLTGQYLTTDIVQASGSDLTVYIVYTSGA